MTNVETPGAIKRFRTTSWACQQTFVTPLKNLPPFDRTIVDALEPCKEGRVTIDQVVFEPRHLIDLLAAHALPADYGHDWSLSAADRKELELILNSTLSDWIDFAFVPTPRRFVIYADHDEYITFFANRKRNIQQVVEALSAQGFHKVSNYVRELRRGTEQRKEHGAG